MISMVEDTRVRDIIKVIDIITAIEVIENIAEETDMEIGTVIGIIMEIGAMAVNTNNYKKSNCLFK